MIIPEETES
jgi:hypothetical protein